MTGKSRSLRGHQMPYKDPEKRNEYCRKWRAENKEKYTEYVNKRNVEKCCPACRKHIMVRRDRKTRVCPHCGVKIHVSRVAGGTRNGKNKHGVRLWVPLETRLKK